jgi:ribulose-5-phosphate 4-epimerase/fuculose-1-phosphate aldolase
VDLVGLRRTIALGCRILAARGLCEDVLGHISARVDDDHILVRCRGPEERGLLFTIDDDVRLVDLRQPDELDGGYVAPNELPIHAAALAARPDAVAVVHAHPPRVVAADLAGVPFPPLVGAYNIPAARMARAGVPVYERSVLINNDDLGKEMAAVLGDSAGCVLRGHGVTTVGTSVEQAVVAALVLDSLAAMALRVVQAGGRPAALPEADLDELPDLGTGFNDTLLWRHHVARLELEGLSLP